MNKALDYKDTVKIVDVTPDDYGDAVAYVSATVKGLFLQGTSETRTGYVDTIGTDAHVYLDINDDYVLENAFRLEGKYLIANIYGGTDSQQWFKISNVKIGQRKLLTNEINCVHCHLTKATPLELEESESES